MNALPHALIVARSTYHVITYTKPIQYRQQTSTCTLHKTSSTTLYNDSKLVINIINLM